MIFTLAEPGGTIIHAEPGEATLKQYVSGLRPPLTGGSVVFDVPENLRSGALTIAPEGTVSTITPSDPIEFDLIDGPR